MKRFLLMAVFWSASAVAGNSAGNGGPMCSNGGDCGSGMGYMPAWVVVLPNKSSIAIQIDGESARLLFLKISQSNPMREQQSNGWQRDTVETADTLCWRESKLDQSPDVATYTCQLSIDVSQNN